MSYFLIRSGEDGIIISDELEEEELLAMITPDSEGYQPYGSMKFLDKVPDIDRGYFINCDDGSSVIIEGEIVQPKPVKVVQKYEL